MNIEWVIRGIVILLFVARGVYWMITARTAAKAKPKTQKRTLSIKTHIVLRNCFNAFVVLQLAGLAVFPFLQNTMIQIIGLIICLIAIAFSYHGRNDLGTNWADGAEYQIKKDHTLITSGIYRYVRHPIYTGVFLFIAGAELVAGSWLVIPLTILFVVGLYIQGKREEKILVQHFGKQYMIYMKHSKMFLPGIF